MIISIYSLCFISVLSCVLSCVLNEYVTLCYVSTSSIYLLLLDAILCQRQLMQLALFDTIYADRPTILVVM